MSEIRSNAQSTATRRSAPAGGPRVSVRLPARLSTIDAETDPFTGKSFFRTCEESSANLSRGGVFVATRDTIPPGRRVLVELEMPGGRSVQTVGRVAWVRVAPDPNADSPAGTPPDEPGLGIQFLGGPRDDLQVVEQFVSRRVERRDERGHEGQEASPG